MKKVIALAIALGLIGIFYYFVLTPFEFQVNLKANTTPGNVIQTVRLWNRSLKTANVMEVDSIAKLVQRIEMSGTQYIYVWDFEVVDDTLTSIHVKISEPGNEIINKILVPVSSPAIEEDAKKMLTEFNTVLQSHLNITQVSFKGDTILPTSFCACAEIASSQVGKANGMMQYYSMLSSFVHDFSLNVQGIPSVRVSRWQHNRDSLKFDFCFPIEEVGQLPLVDLVKYKEFPSVKALKAEYNGNYITSDRAWYFLLHKAKALGVEVKPLPIEFFYNNPNTGFKESEWKAEILLPVVE